MANHNENGGFDESTKNQLHSIADMLINMHAMRYESMGLSKEDAQGIGSLEGMARMGNVEAQYSMGRNFDEGHIVPQNYSEAAHWYHMAAEQGDQHSHLNLERLAKIGNSNAQYLLGNLYSESDKVSQNLPKSVEWYSKAIEQGNQYALYKLACIYTDVLPDYDKSAMLFRKLAGHESAPSPQNLQEVAIWYRRSYELFFKAREGDANAQYEFALMWLNVVDGIPPDPGFAKSSLQKAAEQGHEGAKQMLQKYT